MTLLKSGGAYGAKELADAEEAVQSPLPYIEDQAERRILAFWIHCDLRGAVWPAFTEDRREQGNGLSSA